MVSPMVSRSFMAGITMDNSGAATSKTGVSRVHSGSYSSGLDEARETALMLLSSMVIDERFAKIVTDD
jgi:hypothetical protein